MQGRLFEFQTGEESGLVTVDDSANLASGQTIASCADTPQSGVTVDGAVTVSGGMTTRKLDTPTAGLYRVDYVLTLASPAGSFPNYYYVRVSNPPEN